MADDTKAKTQQDDEEQAPPPPEEKPFAECIEQHFLPELQQAFAENGASDLQLEFVQKTLPLPDTTDLVWQVTGTWDKGYRHFQVYFFDEDIAGQKGFSSCTGTIPPSTIESFMIDERKVSLDLLVFYVLQRLNGEKWLGKN